jgi:hypothetical protein
MKKMARSQHNEAIHFQSEQRDTQFLMMAVQTEHESISCPSKEAQLFSESSRDSIRKTGMFFPYINCMSSTSPSPGPFLM